MTRRVYHRGEVPGLADLPNCPTSGKQSFLTFDHAKRAAKNTRKRVHDAMIPYRCDSCPYFHQGSTLKVRKV